MRSERLLLRPAERGDIETIVGWLNDADVQETLGVRGPLSQAAEERWFEHLQEEQGKSRWHFVVCLRAEKGCTGHGCLGSAGPTCLPGTQPASPLVDRFAVCLSGTSTAPSDAGAA